MNEWILYSDGFPLSANVTEIEFFYDTLSPDNDAVRASTYGRGLWSSPTWYGELSADFESSDTLIPLGCKLEFFDKSAGVPHSWLWTFEGATPGTSTVKNPTEIQYNEEGTFKVSLVISNPTGSDTIVKETYITVGGAIKPNVNFTSTYPGICPDNIVEFTDQSTNCPTAWLWTFTPDDVSFVNGTDETSENPEVLFTNIGRYDVSLTVSNLAGDSTLTKKSYVTVGGKNLPYSEDFEGGSTEYLGWSINNPDHEKTWETDSVIGKDNSKNVAAFINYHDYFYVGPRDQLISPAISFEGFETVYLTFDYAYTQRDNHIDSLIVKISDDCGETWTRVYNNGPDMTEKFVTREPMNDYFTPELVTDWSGSGSYGENNPIIDLTNWANKPMIKIMFESYAGFGNNLYIDNIEISNAVGIFSANNNTNSTFSIYPNPANKKVNIALFKQNEEMEVTITDLNGKALIRKMIYSGINNIDISNLSKGLYFIQVRDNKTSNTEKLIIE